MWLIKREKNGAIKGIVEGLFSIIKRQRQKVKKKKKKVWDDADDESQGVFLGSCLVSVN